MKTRDEKPHEAAFTIKLANASWRQRLSVLVGRPMVVAVVFKSSRWPGKTTVEAGWRTGDVPRTETD